MKSLKTRRCDSISLFLREQFEIIPAAPSAHAGVAFRSKDSWQLHGGSKNDSPLEQPYDYASITKSFFALLVARLVRLNYFEWKTPLSDLLIDLRNTWAGKQTVEALLSHRANLAPHLELFRTNWSARPHQLAALLRQAACARSTDTKKPLYSDLGYILLGCAVERVTHRALDDLLGSEVTGPLNLQVGSSRSWRNHSPLFHECVAPSEFQLSRGGFIRGVVHDDNAWAINGAGLCGHAGLFGTLQGLLAFGCHLLDAVHHRSTKDHFSDVSELIKIRPGGSLKMGFDGISGPLSLAGCHAGPDTFGHLGFTGTSIWCDPQADRVTVLLSNRVCPTRSFSRIAPLRRKIHDFLWRY